MNTSLNPHRQPTVRSAAKFRPAAVLSAACLALSPLPAVGDNLEDKPIFTQFSDPRRRVLDNFEQGGRGTNTRGGAVSKGSNVAVIAENELHVLDSSVPHDTRGMPIKWGGGDDSWVRWNLPAANTPFVGQAQDVIHHRR